MNEKLIIGFVILLSISSGFIGYYIKECEDCKKCDEYNKDLDGLYLGNYNITEVKNYTKEIDPRGDWVCINIREMSFNRAVEVCKHEVGHEIFAEVCEKNITKCLEVMNN